MAHSSSQTCSPIAKTSYRNPKQSKRLMVWGDFRIVTFELRWQPKSWKAP